MKSDLRTGLITATLCFIVFLLAGFFNQSESLSLANQAAPETNVTWEYRAIGIGHGADRILNSDVTDGDWELLTTTENYVVFRRPAP